MLGRDLSEHSVLEKSNLAHATRPFCCNYIGSVFPELSSLAKFPVAEVTYETHVEFSGN